MRRRLRISLMAVMLASIGTLDARSIAPQIHRVRALQPGEGVFAYARISPDGNMLAYSSETADPRDRRRVVRTVHIVDLASQEVVFSEPGIDAYWSNDGARVIF